MNINGHKSLCTERKIVYLNSPSNIPSWYWNFQGKHLSNNGPLILHFHAFFFYWYPYFLELIMYQQIVDDCVVKLKPITKSNKFTFHHYIIFSSLNHMTIEINLSSLFIPSLKGSYTVKLFLHKIKHFIEKYQFQDPLCSLHLQQVLRLREVRQ